MTDDTKPVQPKTEDLEPPTPKEDTPEVQPDAVAELDECRDKLLRTAAEFDNFRKRTEREHIERIQNASTGLIKEILPLLDDFERANETPIEGETVTAYRKGVELIYHQLLEVLQKRGVTPIQTTGEKFDPHFHEAVSHQTSEIHQEGEIIDELRRGYMIGSRLLRPAMVRVSKA